MSSLPPPPPPPPSYAPAQPTFGRQYASFGARLGGLLIDQLIGAIFGIPAIIAFVAGGRELQSCTVNGEDGLCNLPTAGTIGITVLLGAIGSIVYMVILCKKIASGGSWGQRVVGIRVADAQTGGNISAGKAFGWMICHFFSGFVCYLGYLWMLWDKQSQCWHDKMVNTVVVKA